MVAYAEPLKKSWRARWTGLDGKLKAQSGFSTKTEATKYARTQEIAAANGEEEEKRKKANTITVNEWAQEWLTKINVEKSSRRRYIGNLNNHVLPQWGHWRVRDLAQAQQEYQNWKEQLRAEGYAYNTRTQIQSLFSSLCIAAMQEELLTKNPTVVLYGRGRMADRYEERDEAVPVVFSPYEVFLIAERSAALTRRDDEFVLVVTKYFTGMRIGELMGIPRADISPNFQLTHQLYQDSTTNLEYRHVKNAHRRRIDLPPFLVSLLRHQSENVAHPHLPPDTKWCPCGDNVEPKYRHPPKSLLFTGKGQHQHWEHGAFRNTVFYPAARGWFYPSQKAQARPVYIQPRADGGPLGPFDYDDRYRPRATDAVACWTPFDLNAVPHHLRHSLRSLLDELWVPTPLIEERMGHDERSEGRRSVAKRYSHATDQMRARLMEELEEVWMQTLIRRKRMGVVSPVSLVNSLLEKIDDPLVEYSRNAPDRSAPPRRSSRSWAA
ncbi:tyrosine-type recombinase/integrase [Nocardiopsis flavescens]|uniref:tyrosine-type recombinase/integrase n=1 Tax=Nocardiopsis flavescens TaxID=758803 RepID=UPI003665FB32